MVLGAEFIEIMLIQALSDRYHFMILPDWRVSFCHIAKYCNETCIFRLQSLPEALENFQNASETRL
jgi:hypothetical protein